MNYKAPEHSDGFSKLVLTQSLMLYAPNSAGSYPAKAALTLKGAQQIFPYLSDFIATLHGRKKPSETIQDVFPPTEENIKAAADIKLLFDKYGSDKASKHDYFKIYGPLLLNKDSVCSILEVGVGTPHADIVSSMGPSGRPGASLRAFRDWCPAARIFGADIDKRILFTEERIQTFYVDQTEPQTFEKLGLNLPNDFDLIIDDGLHAPSANLITLQFGLSKVKIGGWVIIEDINRAALAFWETIAAIIPKGCYETHILATKAADVFAVKRLS